jgi:hypothetical protein
MSEILAALPHLPELRLPVISQKIASTAANAGKLKANRSRNRL